MENFSASLNQSTQDTKTLSPDEILEYQLANKPTACFDYGSLMIKGWKIGDLWYYMSTKKGQVDVY